MWKPKKTMANNPPEAAALNSPLRRVQFKPGPKPKPRNFPVDPDRDKKIAEFMAKREREKKA